MVKALPFILAIGLSWAACVPALAQAPSADGQIVEVDLNAATPVTVHAAAAKPAAIAQQIAPDDIRFITPPKLNAVSLDAAGEPLLSALARLCVASGANPVQWQPHEARIMLQPQAPPPSGRGAQPPASSMMSAPIAYSGPFAVILTELHSTQQLPLAPEADNGAEADPSNRSISFSITLLPEPKITIFAMNPNADIEQAGDASGGDYTPQHRNDQNASWNAYNQPPVYQFNARIDDVPRATDKLALLKGSLRVRAVKKYMVRELAAAEGKSQEFAVNDLTCKMEPLERQGGNQCRIRIKVARSGQDDASWESSRQMMRNSCAFATDAEGKRLSEGWRSADESGDSITINLIFNQPEGIGPPARITWHAPLEFEEIAVPFEFKDLPVPY